MAYFVAECITLNIGCLKWSPLKEILVTFLSKGHLFPPVLPGNQQSKHEIKINLDLHASVSVNQEAGNPAYILPYLDKACWCLLRLLQYALLWDIAGTSDFTVFCATSRTAVYPLYLTTLSSYHVVPFPPVGYSTIRDYCSQQHAQHNASRSSANCCYHTDIFKPNRD